MIEFNYFHLLLGMGILGLLLIFFWQQKRSLWYLFFFSIFWIYILYIVSVIVFPISPLPKEFAENFRPNLNLIPFSFGRCDMPELCLRNIVGNILLTMPFGFGICFIVRLASKDFLWLPFLVGIALEAAQLIISLVFRSPFRAVDINDVILNATGVLLGYGVFRIFGSLYVYLTERFAIPDKQIFAYVHDVVRRPRGS